MGDKVVDQKDQIHASRELRDKGPHKHGPEEYIPTQARTWTMKIHASTAQKSESPCNGRPWDSRPGQARAGRIKVWARENPSVMKVYRSTRESNRGGQAETRFPPETNNGKWKQRMMCQ